MLQRGLRILAGNDRFLGILVGQLLQREPATRNDLHCARQRFPIARKEPFHLFRGFQVAVRMAFSRKADIIDGGVRPDAAHDILQLAAVRIVKQHVVRDHRAHVETGGEVRQIVQPQLVARPAAQRERHIGAVAKNVRHLAQLHGASLVRQVRDEHADQSLRILGHIGEMEDAGRLAAPAFAEREKAGQPRIGGAVGRIDEDRHPALKIEATADDQAEFRFARRLQCPNDAGQ